MDSAGYAALVEHFARLVASSRLAVNDFRGAANYKLPGAAIPATHESSLDH